MPVRCLLSEATVRPLLVLPVILKANAKTGDFSLRSWHLQAELFHDIHGNERLLLSNERRLFQSKLVLAFGNANLSCGLAVIAVNFTQKVLIAILVEDHFVRALPNIID